MVKCRGDSGVAQDLGFGALKERKMMKVVILAGGMGTRLSEETNMRPKPLIEIGDKPILWHIMKLYSHYGYNDFVICCGYKQQKIKEWFADYFLYQSDVTFDYKGGVAGGVSMEIHQSTIEPWRVTCVDTGLTTMTGGRVKRIQPYIGEEPFLLTYGDGVCDVNIAELVKFHQNHGKLATLTSVVQKQEKGVLEISEFGAVRNFREKQAVDESPINAGFMVLQPEIFDYLKDDTTVLEQEPLSRLANEGQLMSYRHHGFWQCMDSLREKLYLEGMWNSGKAPWKVWHDNLH